MKGVELGGLLIATLAGTAIALLLGKLFAAAVLAALALGIYLRLRRGRVK